MIRVVRKHQPHDVYIGRGGPWGNPFIIGRDGDRASVIAKHKAWLWSRMQREPQLCRDILALDGKVLACFCAPLPCHGDTLAAACEYLKSHPELCV